MKERRILRRIVLAHGTREPVPGLHPVLRRVYAARGIEHDQDLDLGLAHLLPVTTLGGLPAAVELLIACHTRAVARRRGRRLRRRRRDQHRAGRASAATASGSRTRAMWCPDRFRYGYGLTPQIVREAAKLHPDLLVTVDNGISSLEGVREAARLGIDVLVDGSSPARGGAAGGDRHRQSEPARGDLRVEGAGRRRRGVLRDGGADTRR